MPRGRKGLICIATATDCYWTTDLQPYQYSPTSASVRRKRRLSAWRQRLQSLLTRTGTDARQYSYLFRRGGIAGDSRKRQPEKCGPADRYSSAGSSATRFPAALRNARISRRDFLCPPADLHREAVDDRMVSGTLSVAHFTGNGGFDVSAAFLVRQSDTPVRLIFSMIYLEYR